MFQKKSLGFISGSSPKCLACQLNNKRKHQKFPVSGKGKHKILLIFNCPSEVEESTGREGVGTQYRAVKTCLESVGLSFKQDCWKTHAINCFYKKIKNNDKIIENCHPYVDSTIKGLKPKLIIAFGGEASKAVLKNRFSDCSAGRWRGIPVFVPEYNSYVMVTYDPSKTDDGMDGETYQEVIERDINLALKFLNKKPPKEHSPVINKTTDYKELCKELRFIRNNATLISVDYETTGLKPNNKNQRIVANSFTYDLPDGTTHTTTYPIGYKGWFSQEQQEKIVKLTSDILTSPVPKVGHHLKFEEIWGHKKFGVPTRNWIWCTMYTAHILDERQKHCSLKTQAFIYFQAPPYEEELKKFLQSDGGGNALNKVDKAPLMKLLHYNGLDTYYTHLLYKEQKKIIENDPSLYFINNLFLEGALFFADMEKVGFGIKEGYFQKKNKELTDMIVAKKKEILATEECLKFKRKLKRPFRLNSDDDLSSMIYRIMKTEVEKKTKSGKGSTDAEVLIGLEKLGSVWAKEYLEYTKLCTAQDTFVAQILREVDENNRIHPFYHLFTTRTGRSSSSGPNF